MTSPQDAWKRIEPFAMLDLGKLIGQNGGSKTAKTPAFIILYDATNNRILEYSISEAGLTGALGAAVDGDIVWMPACSIALTAGISITAGVALVGMGDNTALTMTGVASGFTLGEGCILHNFKFTLTGTGANVIAVVAEASKVIISEMTIEASGGTSSNIGVTLGTPVNGVLSAYGSGNGVTHSTPARWSTVAAASQWTGAGFRLETTKTLADGKLIVRGEMESVTVIPQASIKLMSSNDSSNSGVTPNTTPPLTGNTSSITWPGVGPMTFEGSGGTVYADDGYFAISTGFTTTGTFTASLTSISWDIGGVETKLWDFDFETVISPRVVRSVVTALGLAASAVQVTSSNAGHVLHSTLAGDTYDLDNSGTTMTVSANQYDHAKVNGTLTYAMSDRGGWDVATDATRHASDINAAALLRHLPAPGTNGNLVRDDGTNWESVTLDSISDDFSKIVITGIANEVLLTIIANATQTANLTEWKDSGGTVLTVIDEKGRLGIGTSNPVEELHIEASGTTTGLIRSTAGSVTMLVDGATGSNSSYQMRENNSNKAEFFWDGVNQQFKIRTKSTNSLFLGVSNAVNLAITGSSGNVGVGTASALAQLHVNGTSDEIQLIVEAHSTQTTNLAEFRNSSAAILANVTGAGNLQTQRGRIKNTTRVTTTYTILTSDEVIFANTDGGAYTVTLPAGVEGQTFKITNSGSTGNNLNIAPDGSEHLLGANSSFALADAESLIITYNTTDGWY